LIRTACEELFLHSDFTAIHAYVKPDNEASRMAFIKAGFKEADATVRQGHLAGHFILVKS
jgi:RimJ/RimL family protein N-acetyltransferase